MAVGRFRSRKSPAQAQIYHKGFVSESSIDRYCDDIDPMETL